MFQPLQSILSNFSGSFSTLATITEKASKNRLQSRHHYLNQFIEKVPKIIESIHARGLPICEKDFKKFDGAFSLLVGKFDPNSDFLEKIRRIEIACKNHFTTLDKSHTPILLKGPEGKEALVSSENLDSEVLQNALKGHFEESFSHEITLNCLSPGAFESLVAILQDKSAEMKLDHTLELLSFAKVYGLAHLFNVVFSSIIDMLKVVNSDYFKSHYAQLDPIFSLLVDVLGFDENPSLTQEKIPPSGQTNRAILDSLYDQISPQNQLTKERFFNTLCDFGDLFAKKKCKVCDKSAHIKLYRFGALHGNSHAQNRLGFMYEYGNGVAQNFDVAVKWYQLSAKQNNPDGQFNLARSFADGKGVKASHKEAIRLLNLAARQSHATAQFLLGSFYARGDGVQKNHQEAIRLWILAANQNNAHAQLWLASSYADGKEVPQDFHRAFYLYKQAAEQGLKEAQYNVGRCYEQGLGVEPDPKKAFYWYSLGAKQGYAPAQCSLASCYEMGIGVIASKSDALKWYKSAAEQEWPEAQFRLGHYYAHTEDPADLDPQEANLLLHQAALQGHAEAQYEFGYHYEEGYGVEKDINTACSWYCMAADQGHASARFRRSLLRANHGIAQEQCNVALFYENGTGVGKNLSEAIKWYQLAANQNYAPAQSRLNQLQGKI